MFLLYLTGAVAFARGTGGKRKSVGDDVDFARDAPRHVAKAWNWHNEINLDQKSGPAACGGALSGHIGDGGVGGASARRFQLVRQPHDGLEAFGQIKARHKAKVATLRSRHGPPHVHAVNDSVLGLQTKKETEL